MAKGRPGCRLVWRRFNKTEGISGAAFPFSYLGKFVSSEKPTVFVIGDAGQKLNSILNDGKIGHCPGQPCVPGQRFDQRSPLLEKHCSSRISRIHVWVVCQRFCSRFAHRCMVGQGCPCQLVVGPTCSRPRSAQRRGMRYDGSPTISCEVPANHIPASPTTARVLAASISTVGVFIAHILEVGSEADRF